MSPLGTRRHLNIHGFADFEFALHARHRPLAVAVRRACRDQSGSPQGAAKASESTAAHSPSRHGEAAVATISGIFNQAIACPLGEQSEKITLCRGFILTCCSPRGLGARWVSGRDGSRVVMGLGSGVAMGLGSRVAMGLGERAWPSCRHLAAFIRHVCPQATGITWQDY